MKRIKEKKERSLGTKLFLKADRCNSPKCVMVRRPHRPGMHGQKRHSVSEYGRQLNEKQKAQLIYGLTNTQMRNLFHNIESKEKLLRRLEQRLDHVVFLLGFAGSPRVARQLVSHGHILVNGRKTTIPSIFIKNGDVISIRNESKKSKMFSELSLKLKKYSSPSWLKLNVEELSGKCVGSFNPADVQLPFDINLVSEFYSR